MYVTASALPGAVAMEDYCNAVYESSYSAWNYATNVTASALPGAVAGGAVGAGVVEVVFLFVGLTVGGPVAGGLFAANQGAAVAAGSLIVYAQAVAMTGAAHIAGAVVGGAIGVACDVAKSNITSV